MSEKIPDWPKLPLTPEQHAIAKMLKARYGFKSEMVERGGNAKIPRDLPVRLTDELRAIYQRYADLAKPDCVVCRGRGWYRAWPDRKPTECACHHFRNPGTTDTA